MDMQQALEAVQNPQTSSETLAFIAQYYPDLWPQILAHPNCYPGLTQWIEQSAMPSVAQDVRSDSATPAQSAMAESSVQEAFDPSEPAAFTAPTPETSEAGAQAAPTGSTGAARSEKKSRRWVVPVSIASAVSLVAGIGGYLWFARPGAAIALDTFYSGIPVVETTVQLPQNMTAKSLRLSPSAHAALRVDDMSVVAFQPDDGSEETTFVAFKDQQVGYPQWAVTVDTAKPQCTLTSKTFDCGANGSFDAQTGWTQGQGSAGTDSSSQGSSSAGSSTAGSGSGGSSTGGSGSEGSATEESTEGSSAQSKGPGDTENDGDAENDGNEATGEDADDVSLGATSNMVLVGPSATKDTPFSFVSGQLKDADGNVLETFEGDRLWALSDAHHGGELWVFSDGQKLVAVVGNTVAWTSTLPAGSTEVNQFDTDDPTWALDGSVLIVGEPDRVVGYDPNSGEEKWVVDVPGLTSWTAQDTGLFLVTGDVLHVAQFVPEQDANQSGSTSVGEVLTLDAPWGDEEFTNGAYQFPAGCVEWTFWDPSDYGFQTMEEMQESTFEVIGGSVGEPGREHISYESSAPLYAGGEAYTVAQFWCANGGMYPFQYTGVYDSSGNLVADEYAEPVTYVGGLTHHPNYSDPQSQGSTFIRELTGIQVAGDQSCGGCAASASATITDGWDGQNLRRLDIVYHTPLGDSRTPNLEAVQAAYDAVASGDDTTAAKYFTSEAMNAIQNDNLCPFMDCLYGEGPLIRNAIFPKGATIEECVLAGSDYTMSEGNSFGQGSSYSSQAWKGQFPTFVGRPQGSNGSPETVESYFLGGTYFCGINTEGTGHGIQSPVELDGDSHPHYTLWLAVQSDVNGNPSNMMAVENFSRIAGPTG